MRLEPRSRETKSPPPITDGTLPAAEQTGSWSQASADPNLVGSSIREQFSVRNDGVGCQGMQTFTEYVRSLDSSGEPIDRDSFVKVWQGLRDLLKRELKKRSLWHSPPSYLGVIGWAAWTAKTSSGQGINGAPPDALDELVSDCYAYVFIDRLRSLLIHLGEGAEIGGLVTLNTRHFLYETQKKHDRLGFRVFQITHAAICEALEDGELHILHGGPAIRNKTILAFEPNTEPHDLPTDLQDIVEMWSDLLLPELVEATGKKKRWLITTLKTLVLRLPTDDVSAFRFGELLDPLKNAARSRWALELQIFQGPACFDNGESVRTAAPPPTDELDRIRLRRCVDAAIDRNDSSPRTQKDLQRIWQELNHRLENGQDMPTRRKLAEQLSIPRRRLTQLLKTLSEAVETCRGARSTGSRVGLGGKHLEGSRDAMGFDDKRTTTLLSKTAEARRRTTKLKSNLHQDRRNSLRPGDLFRLPACVQLPVEWAILEIQSTTRPGKILAMPADYHPSADPVDLQTSDAAVGPLTLRPAFALWLDRDAFQPPARSGTLPEQLLARAKRHLAEERHSLTDSRVDDPELHSWMLEVLSPARDLAKEAYHGEPPSRHLAGQSLDRRRDAADRRRRLALAASILLLTGLSFAGGILWHRAAELEKTHRSSPQVATFDLTHSSETTRSQGHKVQLPENTDELMLSITLIGAAQLPSGEYRLVIQDKRAQGQEILSRPVRVENNRFQLRLDTEWVPPGIYLLQLRSLSADPEPIGIELRLIFEYTKKAAENKLLNGSYSEQALAGGNDA